MSYPFDEMKAVLLLILLVVCLATSAITVIRLLPAWLERSRTEALRGALGVRGFTPAEPSSVRVRGGTHPVLRSGRFNDVFTGIVDGHAAALVGHVASFRVRGRTQQRHHAILFVHVPDDWPRVMVQPRRHTRASFGEAP